MPCTLTSHETRIFIQFTQFIFCLVNEIKGMNINFMTLGKTLFTEHDSGMSFNRDMVVRITILYVEINWAFFYIFLHGLQRATKVIPRLLSANFKSSFNINSQFQAYKVVM